MKLNFNITLLAMVLLSTFHMNASDGEASKRSKPQVPTNRSLDSLLYYSEQSAHDQADLSNAVDGSLNDMGSLRQETGDLSKIVKQEFGVASNKLDLAKQQQKSLLGKFAEARKKLDSLNNSADKSLENAKKLRKSTSDLKLDLQIHALTLSRIGTAASFVAGTSLLVSSFFSDDKKALLTGSILCFGTSFGCYKTSELAHKDLKNQVKDK